MSKLTRQLRELVIMAEAKWGIDYVVAEISTMSDGSGEIEVYGTTSGCICGSCGPDDVLRASFETAEEADIAFDTLLNQLKEKDEPEVLQQAQDDQEGP